MRQQLIGLALSVWMASPLAQPAPERRNWFDDPFFQISSDLPDCPAPAGPRITEAEKRVEAHHRAERGTTCWLAGACEHPNSYAYDRDIAQALQRKPLPQALLRDTTLWVTVQARVVYVEGCVKHAQLSARLEAWARSAPQVQQAVAIVSADPGARAPYKLLTAP